MHRIIALAGTLAVSLASHAIAADAPDAGLIGKGKYLATAADCASCHTQPSGGAAFAGGRYMPTPFGQIPSPNITPDRDTGIGTWSDDDFYRAIHQGIRKDGAYIYPVMPFTSYTKMTRDDAIAIKAYLFSLAPVHSPDLPNKLPFPFNVRASLLGWRQLYFKEGTFQPDGAKSAQINRGAYVVQALEHCDMCHTARTSLGGPSDKAFEGGQVQGWYAPNITSDVREGIGAWSDADIVSYLKTGTAPGKGVAAGPMREAVHTSLQYLTDDDLHAISAYLKDIPAKEQDASARTSTANAGAQAASAAYLTNCASCHQADGKGVSGAVPNLAGNLAVAAAGPQTVYHAILGGLPASNDYALMPSFAGTLTNEDIADITNYVRTSWGNTAPRDATLEGVAKVRRETQGALSGTDPQCPTPEVSVGAWKAAADPKNGIADILKSVDDSNVFAKADAAIGKLREAVPNVANADVVNGLYYAYCPMLAAQPGIPLPRKRWELNRLAQVVYVQLNPHKEAAMAVPAKQ